MGVASQAPHVPGKLRVEKVSEGSVDYVRIRGIIDQTFDGKKLSRALPGQKLIIDLKDTRRIASSGVQRWLEFLASRDTTDVYLVECAPHLISQLGMMSSLAGGAKVLSFYAPYRCHSCTQEFDVRYVVPRDRAAIVEFMPPQHPCAKCGSASDLDDDPHSFFSAIAKQALFDVDHDVTAFVRSRLKYDLTAEATRLRALRYARSKFVYLRLSGPIDRSFPAEALGRSLAGTAIVDLSGATLVDQAGASQWRAFTRAALPFVGKLHLYECPAGFLERSVLPEDLEESIRVLTFQMTYGCATCKTTLSRSMDVEMQHANLRSAVFPETPCDNCNAPMFPMRAEGLQALLRLLPKPGLTPALRRFLVKGIERRADKLDDVLLAKRPRGEATRILLRASYVTVGLAVLILGVVGITAWRLRRQPQAAVAVPTSPEPSAAPKFERPPWIVSGAPSSAYCLDLINLFMCVGISSYHADQDQALAEANDAALEELTNSVGLRIADERFQREVVPVYQDERVTALGALETAVDRKTDEYKKAYATVKESRRRVAEALRQTGGAAVPAQRADWYWEKYQAEEGAGTEFLVFVRFDVSLDAVKALVQRYSVPVDVLGSSALTLFPSLAWRYAQLTGGAMLVTAAPSLEKVGVTEQQVVTAVGETPIRDANDLARALGRLGKGQLAKLTVVGGKDSISRTVDWKVEPAPQ